MRFSIAAHQLADAEHARKLPFADGLPIAREFNDHFLRPPRFYQPRPLNPCSPTWVLQATEYVHSYLGAEGASTSTSWMGLYPPRSPPTWTPWKGSGYASRCTVCASVPSVRCTPPRQMSRGVSSS